MILTDSTKLFVRNGTLVWKILPYMLISILVVCGIGVACCYPLIDELSQAGFFAQVGDIFSQTFMNFRIDELLGDISQLTISLFEIIAQNIATVLPLVIILAVIITLGGSFLINLSELAIADCLYGYMSSNSKFSFFCCFIKNLKKSMKLQLAKLLVVWPVDMLIIAVFVAMLYLFTFDIAILSFLTPFLIVLVLSLLIALRQTLFCMWAPCMIVRNSTVWGALRESFVGMAKNFSVIYSRQLVMTLLYIAGNIATCIFTASVGLLLTIPATLLFSNIMGQVCFFYINGLRFYAGEDEIISPKKREDWEHLNNLKDII